MRQRTLERQPVAFLGRQAAALLAHARSQLAAYLGVAADDVVYVPNPTTAINMVARSLRLRPMDESLTTDHKPGAMERTWRFVCRQTGVWYVRQPLPLSVTDADVWVETCWQWGHRPEAAFLPSLLGLAKACRRPDRTRRGTDISKALLPLLCQRPLDATI
jgi:hypothetical protein